MGDKVLWVVVVVLLVVAAIAFIIAVASQMVIDAEHRRHNEWNQRFDKWLADLDAADNFIDMRRIWNGRPSLTVIEGGKASCLRPSEARSTR